MEGVVEQAGEDIDGDIWESVCPPATLRQG